MLSLYEFNRLNVNDQATFVWNECRYLVSWVEDERHSINVGLAVFLLPAIQF